MYKTSASPEFSHQVITLYYHASESLLHVITHDVYVDGSYKVVDSVIQSMLPLGFNVGKVAAHYRKILGVDNVRAYNASEVRL